MGFPSSSAGKKSSFNAGRPQFDSWVGKIAGEGTGYPLQNSWASLVAQLVENHPAVRETWVQPLGWEEPLEKGTATHSSILAQRIPWTEETGRLQFMGSLDMTERLSLPGAGERHSTRDKGHEERRLAYAKVGSSLRSPPGYS